MSDIKEKLNKLIDDAYLSNGFGWEEINHDMLLESLVDFWNTREPQQQLDTIKRLVNEQAEDEGLWFNPKYITEDYLQQALRHLHYVIEEGLTVIPPKDSE